jgi:hypothetical protein
VEAGFEELAKRWRPILGVEQIIISVIAMLNEPNISSPANIDAAVQVRRRRAPPPLPRWRGGWWCRWSWWCWSWCPRWCSSLFGSRCCA